MKFDCDEELCKTCNDDYKLENGLCVPKHLCRCQSKNQIQDLKFKCDEGLCSKLCDEVATTKLQYKIEKGVCVPKTLCQLGTGWTNPRCTKKGQFKIIQVDADGEMWCVSKWAGIAYFKVNDIRETGTKKCRRCLRFSSKIKG